MANIEGTYKALNANQFGSCFWSFKMDLPFCRGMECNDLRFLRWEWWFAGLLKCREIGPHVSAFRKWSIPSMNVYVRRLIFSLLWKALFDEFRTWLEMHFILASDVLLIFHEKKINLVVEYILPTGNPHVVHHSN